LYANNDAQRNYLSTKLGKTESSILTDVNLDDYQRYACLDGQSSSNGRWSPRLA